MDKQAVERIVAEYMDEVAAGNYLKNKVEQYVNEELPSLIENTLYDVDFHTPAQEIAEEFIKNIRLNKTDQTRIIKLLKETLLEVVEERVCDRIYESFGSEDIADRLAAEAIKEAKKKLKLI